MRREGRALDCGRVDRLSAAGTLLYTLMCLLLVAVGVTFLAWVLIVLPPILQGIYGGS